MHTCRTLGIAMLLAGAAPSQCPVQGLVATAYGTPCGTFGPQVLVSFWAPTCDVVVQLLPVLFMNSVPTGGWLAFDLSPQQTIHPPLGTCPLPASPIVIVRVISSVNLRVPPGLPPFTFWVHGLGSYVNMLNNTPFVAPAVTGLQVALQ
jgi:hypothetical protein